MRVSFEPKKTGEKMSENVQSLTSEQRNAYGVVAALAIEEANKAVERIAKDHPEVFNKVHDERLSYINTAGPFTIKLVSEYNILAFNCAALSYNADQTAITLAVSGNGTFVSTSNLSFLRTLSGQTLTPTQLLSYGSANFSLSIRVGATTLQFTASNGIVLGILSGSGNSAFNGKPPITGAVYFKQAV
ncbi:hypothetical protein NTJ56_26885 [Burkholderia contaminans]|uniref:hypothetical protein n=1 Tax=Burkholderia contaminans TaxID=488447 RepID=UPI001CF221C8|nr:hypothetical protein [Burkholderia contaminans]MCA7913856.1 hypothetical protein [Burkholderia contaminans]UUX39336.1 hypothetical protein NTJ56_26885 [Burkholderia contaminans]